MIAAAGTVALLAAVSAVATWLTLRYARRRLLDLPGERRSHSVPTPRGGGLGITVALLLGTLPAVAGGVLAPMSAAAFAVGLVLVAGIGWIDDHRPLSPWSRLAIQCLAGLVLGAGIYAGQGELRWALLAFGAVPVLVNVWNFMDGIDGIATTQAMIALASFALVAPPGVALLAWAACAACLGFLPFNWPRARIFLGDVGSGTLGYLLAAVLAWTVASLWESRGWNVLVLVLPLSAFLVDASMTLARRVLQGERFWLPHVSHLYQRWAKRAGSHPAVSNYYGLFSLLAGLLTYVAVASGTVIAVAATVLWLVLAAVIWLVQGRRIQHT